MAGSFKKKTRILFSLGHLLLESNAIFFTLRIFTTPYKVGEKFSAYYKSGGKTATHYALSWSGEIKCDGSTRKRTTENTTFCHSKRKQQNLCITVSMLKKVGFCTGQEQEVVVREVTWRKSRGESKHVPYVLKTEKSQGRQKLWFPSFHINHQSLLRPWWLGKLCFH